MFALWDNMHYKTRDRLEMFSFIAYMACAAVSFGVILKWFGVLAFVPFVWLFAIIGALFWPLVMLAAVGGRLAGVL